LEKIFLLDFTHHVINKSDTIENGLDIYLLIGQSNMSGRAPVGQVESDTLQGVFLFNGKKFIPAINPLNKYSTVRKKLSMQKLGPGYSFGKELAEHTGKKIGLVVNARGGTSIESWEKGYNGPHDFDLYENALKQVRKAEKYGTLKAIIWHQGEANRKDADDYMYLLKKLVNDLRRDLHGNVYFVVGEIGTWYKNSSKINSVIDSISGNISNTGFVSADGLKPLYGDITNPHFNTKSQLILGQRYAKKVLKHIYCIKSKE
jgi:hypothetical protein